MSAPRHIEKPPHADRDRVRHLTEVAIVAALDAPRSELIAGDPAVTLDRDRPGQASAGPPSAVHGNPELADPTAELDFLLAHLAGPDRRRPVPTLADLVGVFGPEERERVRVAADAAAADDRSFTDPAIGRSALYGFHYLMWTVPLLERYALSGDVRWLRRWEEIFHRWYDRRDDVRGDWPGLDVVWYTLGVAVRLPVLTHALDVGGAEMDRATRVRLLGSILGGARWLADEHDRFRPGNWQFVGACTLLSTGALFPEFAESADWVATARARITEHLDRDVHSDGGHSERSPSYHRLCLEYLHQAALHAERYLGWPLGDDDRVVAMRDWLVAMATPEGWLPPFQDTGHVAAGPLLVAGHWWTPKPEYKALAEATMAPSDIDTILGALPERNGVPANRGWADAPSATAARAGWLSGSRYFVSRSGRHPGALYCAVNCGASVPHELESHSHRSCLDLVLWGHGQPLVWEAGGPDSYDDPAYHGWFQSPGAHSGVVFDDREPRLDDGATVDTAEFGRELDVLVAHHDGWGVRHRRTLLAVRPSGNLPGYWVLRDEVADEDGWRWLLHGRSAWRRSGDAAFVSAEAPGLVVLTTGVVRASTAVGRTSYPTADGPRWGELHELALRTDSATLIAVLVPFAEEPPEVALSAAGPDLVGVDWGGVVDEIGPRAWARRGGRAEPVAARW